jgi:nucleoid DNA-binding protein
MVYTAKDLLLECSSDSGPLEDYAVVWRAIMRCVEDVVQQGKGITIPQFGKITVMKNSLREGPGEYMPPPVGNPHSWDGWFD